MRRSFLAKTSANLGFVLCALMWVSSVRAFDEERIPAKHPGSELGRLHGVGSLSLAHSLLRYGDTNQDALSLIAAAQIMRNLGSSRSMAEVVALNPGVKAVVGRAKIESILARARRYAGSRSDLLALVNDIEASAVRGAVDGPYFRTSVLAREALDVYRISFRRGEPAIVIVSGDGDSDLDLIVKDDEGREVCLDVSSSDDMACRWVPARDTKYLVYVRNLGIPNEYTLGHN